MSYKDILLKQDISVCQDPSDSFVPYEQLRLPGATSNKHRENKGRDTCRDREFDVLGENDQILYDLTKELKEKFEFKGFMNSCNMSKLMDIFAKYMRLEELDDEDANDECISAEDDFF